MKQFWIGLGIGLALVTALAFAQSVGIGVNNATGIAATVSACPAPGNGFNLCPVGTSPANYTMYVSYAGGAYQLLAPAGATVTGTAPIVVNSGNVSCPSCLTTSSKVATAVTSTATNTITQ